MWLDRTSPWVRGAAAVLAVWLGWSIAWLAWAVSDRELRSEDAHLGFLAYVVMVGVVGIVCLAVAAQAPGVGELLAGAVLSTIGLAGSAWAATQLVRWGEIVDPASDRIAPWQPWDSLASLPFTLVLVAGVLLLVGSVRELPRRGKREEQRGRRPPAHSRTRIV